MTMDDPGPRRCRGVQLAAFLVALAISGLVGSSAQAATRCPAVAGADEALRAVDGESRLHWIDAHLSVTAHRAQVWTWGWGIGISVATLGNWAPLPFVAKEDRIGVGLFLGLGYPHWGAGAWNAFGGSAIGEAIILTQPTGTIQDLRRYRKAALDER